MKKIKILETIFTIGVFVGFFGSIIFRSPIIANIVMIIFGIGAVILNKELAEQNSKKFKSASYSASRVLYIGVGLIAAIVNTLFVVNHFFKIF